MNEKERKRERGGGGKELYRTTETVLVCKWSVVVEAAPCVECRHRGRARERERKREQLAGLPRAPASFLASRRVCKLPRGRHDGNSYGRLAVHSGDAMSPDTRRELVGSRLMVLVQPLGRGVQGRRRAAHTFGARDVEGRAELLYVSSLSCKKRGRGEGGKSRRAEWWGAKVRRAGGGEAAHAPRIGIDPTSRQHLVAPHVPR